LFDLKYDAKVVRMCGLHIDVGQEMKMSYFLCRV
jgi:hypothetical protein